MMKTEKSQPMPSEEENIALLKKILRCMPACNGRIKMEYLPVDDHLLVIIEDNVLNSDIRVNTGRFIHKLIDNNFFKLITVQGAAGVVDVGWFRAFPDAEIRKEVAMYFMKKLEVAPAEYACIVGERGADVELLGLEDKDLYLRAHQARSRGPFGKTDDGESLQKIFPKRSRITAEKTLELFNSRQEKLILQLIDQPTSWYIYDLYRELEVPFIAIEMNSPSKSSDDYEKYIKLMNFTNEPEINKKEIEQISAISDLFDKMKKSDKNK